MPRCPGSLVSVAPSARIQASPSTVPRTQPVWPVVSELTSLPGVANGAAAVPAAVSLPPAATTRSQVVAAPAGIGAAASSARAAAPSMAASLAGRVGRRGGVM